MSGPRLAYLLKKFPRLSETFILNEILGLEKLGIPVHVFSRRVPDDEPRHPQLAGLGAEVEQLPSVSRLDPWSHLFGGSEDGRDLIRCLERLVPEGMGWGHPRFPSLLSEALQVLRRCRDLEIAHVHAHFATDSAVVARLVHRLGGPSYSLTVHAKDIYRDGTDFPLLDGMFAEARFVVTVCDANVRHLAGKLGSEAVAKVRRLYNGIDLDSFAFEPDPGRRESARILAVGRLVEKKGFHTLIDAVARLRTRGCEVRATIVGEGEERERLEAQIALNDMSDHVELTGPMDLGGVARQMRCATVFCLPCVVGSDGNRDALPTVLLEALAAGIPTVSTPVTGVPEILAGGEAGLLVEPGDVEATADALEDLLADPERRRRLAVKGRERVESCFDRATNVKLLSGWLREALERGPRPRRVALVNPDPGIGPQRRKGAAVHLEAMQRAFRRSGAEVVRFDQPDEELLLEELRSAMEGSPIDLLYERYSLGKDAAARFCADRGVPHLLEVNAPLADEESRFRGNGESEAQRQRDRAVFSSCSGVIAVSNAVAAYAVERGTAAEDVHVFPNGVDAELFRPRDEADALRRSLVPAGKVALGFHGRLRPWHGFERIAEAVGRLVAAAVPIHLLVVGEGDFDEVATRHVPSGAYTRIGWVAHEEVAAYVACFDLLALGNAGEAQAYFSPLKLAEAMACGVVPVVPGLGDLPEIVTHGENGWVYRAGSVPALASALGKLVAHKELRRRLAGAARARTEQLSWLRVAEFALSTSCEPRVAERA